LVDGAKVDTGKQLDVLYTKPGIFFLMTRFEHDGKGFAIALLPIFCCQ
jgi:hypothetical protein